ncbi:MAG: Asp-tRNA(Asn)/Glu-tRNA(Gln) amidotransferase subunit GatC [Saccharofermentanales bacterium]
MEISNEMIDYISALAKLKLPKERAHDLQKDLESIIGYMEILKELDTENDEPLSHAFSNTNCFRDDVVFPSMDRDLLLENAPDKKDGCFKVPKTVD